MDTGSRQGAGHLTHLAQLASSPQRHHVFHALRIIEAHYADTPRMGSSRRPRQDPVRLGQAPELAYPDATLVAFRPAEGTAPGKLVNLFFGLFGPHGPLPLHLTEYARDRLVNARDPTFVAFADMLTHRPMSLLYRAWVTGEAAAALDRGPGHGIDAHVAALSGHAGRAFADRDAMPDNAKRHFAARLGGGPANAEGLEAILSSFFGAGVEVEEFVGSWLELDPGDRWQLGAPATLGGTASLGSHVWSRMAKIRIRIGPLDLEAYRRLLPGNEDLTRLAAIVRNYAGDALDWEANPVLRADDVPAARLGADTRLGQTSWLGEGRGVADAADLFLVPPDTHERGAAA
ncbi:type VI secretion system baseplate subunit TssG [Rhodosalinus sp.]|uniref:type VI secretion system baseplate subunit TssG n=1 Tax=Rhodosalinus sp. TaxID=2047741 RepID=UPI00356619B8